MALEPRLHLGEIGGRDIERCGPGRRQSRLVGLYSVGHSVCGPTAGIGLDRGAQHRHRASLVGRER
jgi:hypothetical protein